MTGPADRMETVVLFSAWSDLGRVVLVGTIAYLALVLTLRVSGKRTLSKLNAFDLVVTVALGSVLATVLLSKDVSLAEGVLALVLLVFLQYVIATLSVRSERFQGIVKAEPALLLHQGRFLDGAMRRERITREEILAAVRASGLASIDGVGAVVLETDGTVSVIPDVGAAGPAGDTARMGGALGNVDPPRDRPGLPG